MGASHGIMNIPALFIVLMLSLLLIRGMKESAFVNGIIVITKVTIVILIIAFGWSFIDPANHTPYIPPSETITDPSGVSQHYGGFLGIIGAAGVVFFAFIGFDAVSTAAQETVNPKRDMPIGILGSLVVCTVLYILFAHVLTGIAPVQDFRTGGREESRVFYSMSRDGLVPRLFSDVHPKYRTPYKANIAFFLFVGAFAAFVPEDIVGDMTSIGTLFAFVLVCIGVWVMRVRDPNAPRQFKVPMVPVISTLGVIANTLMIFGLGWTNWARLGAWLVLGLFIYFFYGRHHSKLATAR